MRARHAHTGSGRSLEFLASVAKLSKNIYSKFQLRSYYSFKVISVLKPKFGICAKCPLFSDPVTYSRYNTSDYDYKLQSLWYNDNRRKSGGKQPVTQR